MKTKKRIASLFRELAEAFDQLDAESKPRSTTRHDRERARESSRGAVTIVQDNLRRGGIKVA